MKKDIYTRLENANKLLLFISKRGSKMFNSGGADYVAYFSTQGNTIYFLDYYGTGQKFLIYDYLHVYSFNAYEKFIVKQLDKYVRHGSIDGVLLFNESTFVGYTSAEIKEILNFAVKFGMITDKNTAYENSRNIEYTDNTNGNSLQKERVYKLSGSSQLKLVISEYGTILIDVYNKTFNIGEFEKLLDTFTHALNTAKQWKEEHKEEKSLINIKNKLKSLTPEQREKLKKEI